MEELPRNGFNPVKVYPLWNRGGHSGFAYKYLKVIGLVSTVQCCLRRDLKPTTTGRGSTMRPKIEGINCLEGWLAEMTTNLENLLVFISARIQI
jgi:hypothetical protein